MKLNFHEECKAVHGIGPIAAGTTGTGQSSNIIDRRGYNGVEWVVSYGASTATAYAVSVVVLEGDATGAMTSVADADLVGTEALAGISTGARVSGTNINVCKRIGYKGLKRYTQCKMINVGAATGIIGAACVLYSPEIAPVSGQ